MNKNRYGLSRHIPESVKRIVRQRCGFGCAICGNAIYEYEHFAPEFKDCKNHSEDGITLLCLQDHGKKTRGYLSQETVKKANGNPKALQNGFWENFDFADQYPKIFLGSNELFNCQNIILVEGKSILQVDPPEEKGGPFRLSGSFFDESGNEVLVINKNEWKGDPGSWDVETTAGKIIIKTRATLVTTVLDISVKDLPEKLIISNLNMNYKGHKFLVSDGVFTYVAPNGGRFIQQGCKSNSSELHKSFMIKILKNGQFFFLGRDI